MTKRSEIQRAKDRAWEWFSKYVRKKYADEDGYVDCITCNNRSHWKEMDPGHAISGRRNAALCNEYVVFPQCKRCNLFDGGAYERYLPLLQRAYGNERWEEIAREARASKKMTVEDWRETADYYRKKFNEL